MNRRIAAPIGHRDLAANQMIVPCTRIAFHLTLLVASTIGPTGIADARQIQEPEKRKIKFPKNNDPVVEFDITGGFRMAQPNRFKPTPRLRIFKDGSIICGTNSPQFKEVRSKISIDELTALLEATVNQDKFFEMDSESVKTKIANAQNSIRVADAGTSEFTINLERGKHTCKVYALKLAARHQDDIPEIKALIRLENQMFHLIHLASLGGKESAEEYLKQANQKIAQKDKSVTPLELSDLVSAVQYSDGRIQGNFRRRTDAPDGKPSKLVAALITKSPDEKNAIIQVAVTDYSKR